MIRTPAAILRATLEEGEARQGRGEPPAGVPFELGESYAPYWVGYFNGIARRAIESLEALELERGIS